MAEAKLPIAYRDSCANLLIPLNRCRVDTYYLPWKCEVRPKRTSSCPLSLLPNPELSADALARYTPFP